MLIQKGKGYFKLKSRDAIANSFNSHLCQLDESCCGTSTNSVFVNVKSGGNQLRMAESEAKIKPSSCLDSGLTLIKSDMNPISGSKISLYVEALSKCRLVQNVADKDKKLRDKSMLARQEGDTRVISTLLSSELSSEMVSVMLAPSNLKEAKVSEETDTSPNKAASGRLLKYTFQRKRKKESFSDSDEKTPAEIGSSKKREGEEQNNAQETVKSSLMNEITRDSQ